MTEDKVNHRTEIASPHSQGWHFHRDKYKFTLGPMYKAELSFIAPEEKVLQ